MERLHTLASTTDGFKISEEDLKARGPGDCLSGNALVVGGLQQLGTGYVPMILLEFTQKGAPTGTLTAASLFWPPLPRTSASRRSRPAPWERALAPGCSAARSAAPLPER